MHLEEIRNSLFDLGDIENIKLQRLPVLYNGKSVMMYVFPNIPQETKDLVEKIIQQKEDEAELIFTKKKKMNQNTK